MATHRPLRAAILPICVGTLLATPSLNAQQPAVVVTATRTPQPVKELTSDVTVITREEIARSGQSSLVEILQSQPGVQILSSGGIGTQQTLFLRGTNADHTVVLVDGMRLNSATAGTTALQHIPPSQIERIEILRGPASGLYGADAIGGVVQIFTRAPEGTPRLSASAGIGSYNTQEYTLGYGGEFGSNAFSINVGHLSSDSFSSTTPVNGNFNPDDDSYVNRNVSARFAHRFNRDHELGGNLFVADSRAKFDAFPSAFDHRQDETLSGYGAYSRNRLMPNWLSTLRLGRGTDDLSAVSGALPNLFKTSQDQASWQNEFKTSFGELLFAAERLKQRVQSDTVYLSTERSNDSIQGGYTGRFGAHSLIANLRSDDNSQFGDKATGSVSYGYEFTRQWRASAAYGTAFKVPTFNQLYFPPGFGCPAFGNPNLRPESSRNVEAALRFESGAHSAGVVGYRNNVQDLIVAAAIPGFPFCVRAENVGQAQIEGLTFNYGYAAAGWTVRTNADLLSPQDKSTGRTLARRARRTGSASVARALGPWSLGAELVAVGPRFDTAANSTRMSGYSLLNAFASYRINPAWSIQGRVNNLLDKNYEMLRDFAGTPFSFANAGFNMFVALRYEPQ